MNMKTNPRTKRGIVGIEAAIVLIAFVVVAAALAFVALNMGFYTTQRSKEVMSAGLAQASSSLEIDGSVLAYVGQSKLKCMAIPIRLSAGQKDVDLTPNKTQISLWVINKAAFTNLYRNTSQALPNLTDSGVQSLIKDIDESVDENGLKLEILRYNFTALCKLVENKTIGGIAIIWGPGSNGDNVLSAGEKALVIINFEKIGIDGGLSSYDVIKVEIKPPLGAALTVERTVPASLTAKILDLG